jgi:sugar phosphate isomerase/epimerase
MNRRTFVSGLTAAGTVVPFSGRALAEPGSGPGFHLGAVTYNTLKNFDVETIIRVLETAGFEGVELRTGHKHGVEPSISRDERSRVRRRFEQSRIRLVSYGTTCRFQSPDPAERNAQLEVAKQFVDLAHDTGALGIKIQPMGFPPDVSRETSIRNFGASLRELGDYGAHRKIEIWMEVHGKVTADPPVAAAIVKAAGHENVGVCWNSNPNDLTDGSVRESFRLLEPWIRSVHLHELADTAYPWRELFALLKAAKYDRYTFAEVAESLEPERYLQGYRALWTELSRP